MYFSLIGWSGFNASYRVLSGLLFDAKQLYDMDSLKLFKNLILILWQGIQKVHRKK
jgi:hypothetical protein